MSTESLRHSFLGLEGLHVFITGAAGAIGGEAVREFLGVLTCSSLSYFDYCCASWSNYQGDGPNTHLLTLRHCCRTAPQALNVVECFCSFNMT